MSSQRGFTLIEIMIVLAIMAALITVGAPRLLKNNEGNIKAVARNFIVLSKELRNKARLTNSTYRLAISMEADEPKYWVERANGPQAVDPEAYEKEKEHWMQAIEVAENEKDKLESENQLFENGIENLLNALNEK